jgi:hypothetical protein
VLDDVEVGVPTGDPSMVVSATPSANTVRRYRRRGFELMAPSLSELFERESRIRAWENALSNPALLDRRHSRTVRQAERVLITDGCRVLYRRSSPVPPTAAAVAARPSDPPIASISGRRCPSLMRRSFGGASALRTARCQRTA